MTQTLPAQSVPPIDLSLGATDVRDRPLPVDGFKGTPEEIERQWYEQVYRGHGDSMAQLTWRAVLIGHPALLGVAALSPSKGDRYLILTTTLPLARPFSM